MMDERYCTCLGPCDGACGAGAPLAENPSRHTPPVAWDPTKKGPRFAPRHTGRHKAGDPQDPNAANDPHYRLVDRAASGRPVRDLEAYCRPVSGTKEYVEQQAAALNLPHTFHPVDDRFDLVESSAGDWYVYDRTSTSFIVPTDAQGQPRPPFRSRATARNFLTKHAGDIGHYACPTTPRAIERYQDKAPEVVAAREAARLRAAEVKARESATSSSKRALGEAEKLRKKAAAAEAKAAKYQARASGPATPATPATPAAAPLASNPAKAADASVTALGARLKVLEGRVQAVELGQDATQREVAALSGVTLSGLQALGAFKDKGAKVTAFTKQLEASAKRGAKATKATKKSAKARSKKK